MPARLQCKERMKENALLKAAVSQSVATNQQLSQHLAAWQRSMDDALPLVPPPSLQLCPGHPARAAAHVNSSACSYQHLAAASHPGDVS